MQANHLGEALQRQFQAFATYDTCDRLTGIQATTLIITEDKMDELRNKSFNRIVTHLK